MTCHEACFPAPVDDFTSDTKRALGYRFEIIQSHVDGGLETGSALHVTLCCVERGDIDIGSGETAKQLPRGVEGNVGQFTHEFKLPGRLVYYRPLRSVEEVEGWQSRVY